MLKGKREEKEEGREGEVEHFRIGSVEGSVLRNEIEDEWCRNTRSGQKAPARGHGVSKKQLSGREWC
ncbi:MAG: hypothetical protein II951_07610 [Bacteroidales bacterium]|nr:hypothetical protein [Bacteroidales bacterium]